MNTSFYVSGLCILHKPRVTRKSLPDEVVGKVSHFWVNCPSSPRLTLVLPDEVHPQRTNFLLKLEHVALTSPPVVVSSLQPIDQLYASRTTSGTTMRTLYPRLLEFEVTTRGGNLNEVEHPGFNFRNTIPENLLNCIGLES